MDIKVKYKHTNSDWYLNILDKGDWIDLRATEIKVNGVEQSQQVVEYKTGDVLFVNFGFACELPPNHEAYIVPRSSTFKNFGLILTNQVGIIDNSYKGDTDYWLGMFFALKDGKLELGDRIAQFRIQEKMPRLNFEIVDQLDNENRSGYGSSGVK